MVMLDPTQPQKKPNALQPLDPNAPQAGAAYNPGAAANLATQGRPASAPGAGGNDFNAAGGSQQVDFSTMAAPAAPPKQVVLGMGASEPAPKFSGVQLQGSPASTPGDVKPGPTFSAPTQFHDAAVPGPTFTAPSAPAPAPGALPAGATDVGNGMVKFADGQVLPRNHPAFAAKVAGAGAVAAPTPGTAAPTAPGAPAPAAPADVPGQYQAALLKMLDGASTPASLSDPALKAQSDAFSVGQTRATEQARNAMAERSAAQGGPGVNSGAFDSGLAGLYQHQGEAQGGFNAGLVGDAAKQKLTQMTTALSMMGNDINSDKGRALQKAIADTQAQIQREGIQQQGALGGQDIALRDKLGTGGLNAQIAQMLQQNQQFWQGLGAQIGMNTAGLNQQAILAMLGGL